MSLFPPSDVQHQDGEPDRTAWAQYCFHYWDRSEDQFSSIAAGFQLIHDWEKQHIHPSSNCLCVTELGEEGAGAHLRQHEAGGYNLAAISLHSQEHTLVRHLLAFIHSLIHSSFPVSCTVVYKWWYNGLPGTLIKHPGASVLWKALYKYTHTVVPETPVSLTARLWNAGGYQGKPLSLRKVTPTLQRYNATRTWNTTLGWQSPCQPK